MLKKGGYCFMTGTKRLNIKPGMRVAIVLKKDQRSGKLTEGIVLKTFLQIRNIIHMALKSALNPAKSVESKKF